MTLSISRVAAAVVLASAGATSAGVSLLHAAAVQPLLLPLTQADLEVAEFTSPTPGSDGCTSGFSIGRKDYIQLTDRQLMLRTPAGRQICALTKAQENIVENFKGSIVCGGVRFSFRQTGPVKQGPSESDSGSAPVVMTVSKGIISYRLKGDWGTGC